MFTGTDPAGPARPATDPRPATRTRAYVAWSCVPFFTFLVPFFTVPDPEGAILRKAEQLVRWVAVSLLAPRSLRSEELPGGPSTPPVPPRARHSPTSRGLVAFLQAFLQVTGVGSLCA